MDRPQPGARWQFSLHRLLGVIMDIIDHTTLHRGAKYFMDSGRAATLEEAMALLRQFGLAIHVGWEVAHSEAHQVALLTLINITRRTFLGGVAVIGVPDCACTTLLGQQGSLKCAVSALGGTLSTDAPTHWPLALIGTVEPANGSTVIWQLTWEGWRGGAIPHLLGGRLNEGNTMSLAPALAAAFCAAEAFSYYAGDHPLAGRRVAGLSLWKPGSDWMTGDTMEPVLQFLPSRLWIIGLGNLGQAFAWLLASLPYRDPSLLHVVLQDFDRLAPSNDSTSVLSCKKDVGMMKTRMVSAWLEERGFSTMLEERRFGAWTQRHEMEPGVALCGVDNALARASLDKAGFGLVVEAGLGGGPQAFRSLGIHTFPASRTPADIWAKQVAEAGVSNEHMPAYQTLKRDGMDECGLTQLASRTVGVPFVGLVAAGLAIAELLRRLHSGQAFEFVTGSLSSPQDFEAGTLTARPYEYGFCEAAPA